MKDTLKMMKGIITGKENTVSENELIQNYQKNNSSNILAYMFINNYNMIYKISQLFPSIDNQDKASFCLSELDKALKTYNFKYKFSTYFWNLYKNRLSAELLISNAKKRKIEFSYNIEYDLKKYESIHFVDGIEENIDIVLDSYNLTNSEKELCKLMELGYTVKEAANNFNLKPVTIYKKLKSVKQKILKLV